jgi:hypothetical protein
VAALNLNGEHAPRNSTCGANQVNVTVYSKVMFIMITTKNPAQLPNFSRNQDDAYLSLAASLCVGGESLCHAHMLGLTLAITGGNEPQGIQKLPCGRLRCMALFGLGKSYAAIS